MKPWLWRVLKPTACVVAALLVGVLVIAIGLLLDPPSELLRRAALPIARQVLSHPNIHIGSFELRPRNGVEIRDIWLGPPEGYTLPLLTIRRILVEYDLSDIGDKRLTVRRLRVERPVAQVEKRNGKLNWLAFLDGLPKSPPKEEPPSEPSDFVIDIDEASVVDIAAYFDDSKQRAVLEGLSLSAKGTLGGAGKLEVNIDHVAPHTTLPNLALKLPGAQPVIAKLRSAIKVRARVERLVPPKAEVDVLVDLAGKELVAGGDRLKPLRLTTNLTAAFDQEKDRADLKKLQIALDKQKILDLIATVHMATSGRGVLDATLRQLVLPLDQLAPYARAVRDDLQIGGRVAVQNLRLKARMDQPAQPQMVAGALSLEGVWARLGKKTAVEGLDIGLRFSARPNTTRPVLAPEAIVAALPALTADIGKAKQAFEGPALTMQGSIRLSAAKAAGARLANLDLRIAAGVEPAGALQVEGLGTAAARLRLGIAGMRYSAPGVGTLRASLRTELQAAADLQRKDFTLQRLVVDLPRLLRLKVSAELKPSQRFDAKIELLTARLATLVAQLPPALRRNLGGRTLDGRIGLQLHARGRVPDNRPGSPLARTLAAGGPVAVVRGLCCSGGGPLAVRADGGLSLKELALTDPAAGIKARGLSGRIGFDLRQGRIGVAGKLQIARLQQKAALALTKVEIPIDLAVDPRQITAELGFGSMAVRANDLVATGVKLRLGTKLSPSRALVATRFSPSLQAPASVDLQLDVKSVSQRSSGLRVRGIKVSKKLQTTLPVGRVVAKRWPLTLPTTKVTINSSIRSLLAAAPGNQVKLGNLRLSLDIDRTVGRRPRVEVGVKLGALTHRQLALAVSGVDLAFKTDVDGVPLRFPAPPLRTENVIASPSVKLSIGSLSQRAGPLARPLKNTTVDLGAFLSPGGRLKIAKLAVRVPSRHARIDLHGAAGELFAPRTPKNQLPFFDLKLRAAIDAPRTRSAKRASTLVTGLRMAGKLGLSLHAKRSAINQVDLEGRLIADRCNLWQRGVAMVERDQGGFLRTVTRLSVNNLNIDVPIAQRVKLAAKGGAKLPAPKQSIFEASSQSALYGALRPYSAKRANLALDGVQLQQRITAISPEGHFINTRSRGAKIGKIALDLALSDSTLALSRLYVSLFGGDIAGALSMQLLRLQPMDARLLLKLQVAGIDLGHLDPARKKAATSDELSTLINLKYQLAKQEISGRVEITRMSLKQLDGLLAFLDPNNVDHNVRKNRQLINSWYMKLAKVKLVSIWIDYGNLNMDIEVELPAYVPIGAYLRSQLRRNRIRRLNIIPLLPKF